VGVKYNDLHQIENNIIYRQEKMGVCSAAKKYINVSSRSCKKVSSMSYAVTEHLAFKSTAS